MKTVDFLLSRARHLDPGCFVLVIGVHVSLLAWLLVAAGALARGYRGIAMGSHRHPLQ